MPKVFIAYSQEDEAHQEWVRLFAERLIRDGIEVNLDQFNLDFGDRLPHYMEQSVASVDFVLIICTPTYREKLDARKGGVGYEAHIITGEIYEQRNEKKYIPVIRKGDILSSMPRCLKGKLAVDLKEGRDFEKNYERLIATIKGKKNMSTVSKEMTEEMPLDSKEESNKKDDEPIHIMEIVQSQITEPGAGSLRGTVLYRIPFRLSRKPSSLWSQLFVQSWNHPPRYTSMHRPGIASVRDDLIILNGTTIEEVQSTHQRTLLLCIEEANKKEKEFIEHERIAGEREAARQKAHRDNVADIIKKIKF